MTQPPVPMNQSATWKRFLGNDGDDNVYSEAPIICRIEQKTRMVKLLNGDTLESVGMLWCVEAARPGDIIRYQGRDFPVGGIVSQATDLDGVVHWRVMALGGGKEP